MIVQNFRYTSQAITGKKDFSITKRNKFKRDKNFRGSDNNIGESFSDNQNINILNDYIGGARGFQVCA